jgi:hypothetical protein
VFYIKILAYGTNPSNFHVLQGVPQNAETCDKNNLPNMGTNRDAAEAVMVGMA